MNGSPLLATLLLVSGCARTLPADEWVTALPRGACRVDLEYTDANGTFTTERHHAADGRVLSGTSRLRYHGRSWERFGYDDRARLVEIYTFDERGRLTEVAHNGQVRERRRYTGACDAVVTGPRAPSPLADLGAVVCHGSPASVMDRCFTSTD